MTGRMFRTVRTAATEMRADEAKFLDKYRTILEGMGKDLSKPLPTAVVATELGVPTTFRTRAEILGFLMHMGNESSMRKNLLGRQYVTSREVDGLEVVDTQPAWNFLNRMVSEGVLTKQHFDGMQQIWDMMEELKSWPTFADGYMRKSGGK